MNRLLLLLAARCSYNAGSFSDFRGVFLGTQYAIGDAQPTALMSQVVAALGAHVHLADSLIISAKLASGGRMYSSDGAR